MKGDYNKATANRAPRSLEEIRNTAPRKKGETQATKHRTLGSCISEEELEKARAAAAAFLPPPSIRITKPTEVGKAWTRFTRTNELGTTNLKTAFNAGWHAAQQSQNQ